MSLEELTPEQIEFVKKLTDGQRMVKGLTKPLWALVTTLVFLTFGIGGWWANYQNNAQEGSPAFKSFVKEWSDRQNKRDLEQAKINEKLTTLIEQMDKRLDRDEERLNK